MPPIPPSALDSARRKAYLRLIPLLFVSYMIAYVDRVNVSLAALTMREQLPEFDAAVIGQGAGLFFLGYFLLEIPGSLLVERWSARKWFFRIMVTWGIFASLTAAVQDKWQFYAVRFLLGLAEAGFYPGVIVYLSHWFSRRDRAKALAWFFIATPMAQIVSPRLSYPLLRIGSQDVLPNGEVIYYPTVLGLYGWQWMYIAWGVPAVILGVVVLLRLPDWPRQAKWLTDPEKDALEAELARDRLEHPVRHMSWLRALREPRVLLLAAAYFFVVTGNYAVEVFLPTIFREWYSLDLNKVTWLVMIPPIGALVGQLVVGWSSDRTRERRLHASLPIYLAVVGLICVLFSKNMLYLTVALFVVVAMGLKAYLPAFWSLPNLFLAEAAAASSIGFINSVGNLGGYFGPMILGTLRERTDSFVPGLIYLCASMTISATIIVMLGLGKRPAPEAERAGASDAEAPDALPLGAAATVAAIGGGKTAVAIPAPEPEPETAPNAADAEARARRPATPAETDDETGPIPSGDEYDALAEGAEP